MDLNMREVSDKKVRDKLKDIVCKPVKFKLSKVEFDERTRKALVDCLKEVKAIPIRLFPKGTSIMGGFHIDNSIYIGNGYITDIKTEYGSFNTVSHYSVKLMIIGPKNTLIPTDRNLDIAKFGNIKSHIIGIPDDNGKVQEVQIFFSNSIYEGKIDGV